MAPIGTIYTFEGHAYGNRARIAAAIAGLDLTFSPVKLGETNKTPEYLAKYPSGKVPGFESADGFTLFESSAIAKYVSSLAPNSGLLGTSPKESALVDQWISFIDTEIGPHKGALAGIYGHKIPYTKPFESHIHQRLHHSLSVIEGYLHKNTFLVGHRISLADIVYTTTVQKIFTTLFGATERSKFPNSIRLFETIANQPAAKPLLGSISYAEKGQAFVAPAKEKKESKPAQVVAAIKEKIAPKPKAAAPEEDDDDEPAVAEEPKPKNPLDLLPKSNFNLEDWKRAYSNMDTRGAGGSIEWFYQKFDAEGFSLWKVAYKYPEELTQVFMSSNLIGGYFNRLEASRKYLFGSMGVLGVSNASTIEGVLIARGQDIIPVVNVAPDWESYNYEKIDLSKPEDKAYFEAALAWDLESGGKKWADGKNFK